MTWYNLEYNITQEGKFSLAIEGEDCVVANEDYADSDMSKWEIAYELLESLWTDDCFSMYSAKDIFMNSISQETRDEMMAMIGQGYPGHAVDEWFYQQHPDKGIVVHEDYWREFICELGMDDHGDITEIHRLWLLPEGWDWVDQLLNGETLLLEPITPPLSKGAKEFLSYIIDKNSCRWYEHQKVYRIYGNAYMYIHLRDKYEEILVKRGYIDTYGHDAWITDQGLGVFSMTRIDLCIQYLSREIIMLRETKGRGYGLDSRIFCEYELQKLEHELSRAQLDKLKEGAKSFIQKIHTLTIDQRNNLGSDEE